MKEGHTAELRELVKHRHGEDQLDQLRIPLSSFAWKLHAAGCHAAQAHRVITEDLCDAEIDNEVWAAARRFVRSWSSQEEQDRFRLARFASECHVIASAQSLHSSTDILGKVAYISLNLAGRGLNVAERGQDPWRIRDKLRSAGYALNVADSIDTLVADERFLYLRAYVNTTKHRRFVNSSYQIELGSDAKHGIRIKAFEYSNRPEDKPMAFRAKWARDFTTSDSALVNNLGLAVIGEICDVLTQELGNGS